MVKPHKLFSYQIVLCRLSPCYVTFTCHCAGGYPKAHLMLRLYVEYFQMKIYWREKLRVERALSLSSVLILANIIHSSLQVTWIKLYGPLIFLTPLRFSSTSEFKECKQCLAVFDTWLIALSESI